MWSIQQRTSRTTHVSFADFLPFQCRGKGDAAFFPQSNFVAAFFLQSTLFFRLRRSTDDVVLQKYGEKNHLTAASPAVPAGARRAGHLKNAGFRANAPTILPPGGAVRTLDSGS